MARVLITGADGFTGRYLAPLLASAGYEVHGMVQRGDERGVEGVVALHAADLVDPLAVQDVVRHVAPDRIVHLAAIAHIADGDPRSMYLVNLLGTRNLLESLVGMGRRPEAVVLASSANVYGNAREGALDETTQPEPANDYAVSKLAMEAIARLYASRLPLVVCRPFNYTGRGQSEAFLLPKIVSHSRSRAEWIELGNLAVARDFSDVRDVTKAYARLLETPAAIGRTINLCSGTAHSLEDVLAMVEALSSHSLPVRVNPALVRQNEVRILKGDRTLLASLVPSLPPPRPLLETLRWMLEEGQP